MEFSTPGMSKFISSILLFCLYVNLIEYCSTKLANEKKIPCISRDKTYYLNVEHKFCESKRKIQPNKLEIEKCLAWVDSCEIEFELEPN